MRFLKFSSLCLLLFVSSCGTIYQHLQPAEGRQPSALRFRPDAEKALYRCVIDGGFFFKKYHLSGILLYKKMPDATTRIVFQNEMGYTFFDFQWDKKDSFSVKQVIPQMDKPALVKTLRKDMEMLLMNSYRGTDEQFYRKDSLLYHRFPLTKGFVYYLEKSGSLQTIQNTGKRKVVSVILPANARTTFADSLFIKHHKAHFTITLKKIQQDAD